MARPTVPTARWKSASAKVASTPTRRLIVRSIGPQKSGKTRFALTGPAPVYVHSFDTGLEGVVEQFVGGGKDIRALEYPFNAQDFATEKQVADAANDIWSQLLADYAEALKDARTVVIDKETEMWELLRNARFGASNSAPRDYPQLNAEYRTLIRQAYGAGVNLVLIQGVKEKWVSKMDPAKGKLVAHNTGELEAAGMKEVGYLVQVNLTHTRKIDDDSGALSYHARIDDARHDAGQMFVGQEFESLDFPTLGQMMFPDSSEEDWL